MPKHEPTYRETIAQLQAGARQRQAEYLEQEAKDLLSEIEVVRDSVAAAYEQGDQETALYEAGNLNGLEANLQSKLDELNAVAPQQAPAPSERKAEWISRRQDLAAHPQAPQIADAWHNYITGKMGIPDDTPEYFEAMGRAVEPAGYEPLPTPDGIVETINKTSKYGTTAKDYNKGVKKLIAGKNRGDYPDR